MAQATSLATPGLTTFLRSISSEPIDNSIAYFTALLKRRQIRGSKACALATASLLRRVVSQTRGADSSKLIRRVQEVGKLLVEANPKELAVGNIVRRVLGLIRDEEDEQRDPDSFSSANSDAGSLPPTPGLEHSTTPFVNGVISPPRNITPQRPPLFSAATGSPPSARPMTSMYSILAHPTMRAPQISTPSPSGTQTPTPAASTDLRAEILEGITEIIDELDQSDDQIANYALDHISPSETIFTYSSSLVVQRFLLKAASKRRFTVIHAESYPNNHKKTHAIVTGNHDLGEEADLGIDSFQKPLISAGITVILIPDSAIFALMSRVSKVILGASIVLSNGSFVGPSGSKTITKAAGYHRVPVLVLAATYMLSPQYPYDPDELIEYGDVNKVIPMQDGELRRGASVRNPVNEFVEAKDVDLYVTNLGGVSTEYVQKVVKDQYREEDVEL